MKQYIIMDIVWRLGGVENVTYPSIQCNLRDLGGYAILPSCHVYTKLSYEAMFPRGFLTNLPVSLDSFNADCYY